MKKSKTSLSINGIKRIQIASFLAAVAMVTGLSGCIQTQGQKAAALDKTALVMDVTELSVPDSVRIVGLGEASHGTSEFQQLKGDIFKALVANNGARAFAIEGDFGGSAKVNEYIHGGNGTAEEAVSQIGFNIYKTQEIADIAEWMRAYNETAPDGGDLRFYGYDAQRYDNNKALLLYYLSQNMPVLSDSYAPKLAPLTDTDMYSLEKSVLAKAKEDITELIAEMEAQKPSGNEGSLPSSYEKALEYAQSLLDNTTLQLAASSDYNKVRDEIMTRKVQWIEQHEKQIIFINGHNGHIGRQSVSGYTCMGDLLNQKYGKSYFPIGTEALHTVLNARTGDAYKEFSVDSDNVFTAQLEGLTGNLYFLPFEEVAENPEWQKALSSEQTMTALNVEFSDIQKMLGQYTLKVLPTEAYSGIIVLKDTNPTHFFE
jgi:erythromycin esterase